MYIVCFINWFLFDQVIFIWWFGVWLIDWLCVGEDEGRAAGAQDVHYPQQEGGHLHHPAQSAQTEEGLLTTPLLIVQEQQEQQQ